MKKTLIALLATLSIICEAQELSYGQYMEQVLTRNIALTAASLNIDISAASTQASKTHNDPTLAITYSSNEDWDKKLGYAIEGELGRTFTFGVRRGRIAVAEKEEQETAALLEEYIRNLRADATIAYLENLKAIHRLKTKTNKETRLLTIARNDSIRHAKGDISKADRLESRMAATLARNHRLAAEAAVRSTAITLGYYMSNLQGCETLTATGSLEINEPAAPLATYLERALQHRADLQAALYRIDIAEASRKFNAAQRRTELNAKIAATYNKGARNETPHSPSFATVKAGIAIPLKFSNLNKGARTVDNLLVQQARQEAENARLLVQSEVMQAYNEYTYASTQAAALTTTMVGEMNTIVESKKKAYEMGDIPFLDYISAERRQDEMEEEHIEALFEKAVKWVELQRAAGCGIELSTHPITHTAKQ